MPVTLYGKHARLVAWGFVAATQAEIAERIGPFSFVAEQDGVPVGFAIGRPKVAANFAILPDGTAYLEVEDIYLIPEVRGRGIGSRLLNSLLEGAERQGIHRALVYSSVKNIGPVMRFYEHQGFRSWCVQMFR